jgi:hypothetical protein
MSSDCRWIVKLEKNIIQNWISTGFVSKLECPWRERLGLGIETYKINLYYNDLNLNYDVSKEDQHSLELLVWDNSDIVVIDSTVRIGWLGYESVDCKKSFSTEYIENFYMWLLNYVNEDDIVLGSDVSIDYYEDGILELYLKNRKSYCIAYRHFNKGN